jgi:hypothetical protein
MIKFSINTNSFLKDINQKNSKEQKELLEKIAEYALHDLEFITPKDTGEAANAWELKFHKNTAIFSNEKEYVKYLNAGSSKQAPANFIETTMLDYGIQRGPIVTYE